MITGVEIKRKIVHLATLSIPIGYAMLPEKTVVTILFPLFFGFLIVDLLRHYHSGMAALVGRGIGRIRIFRKTLEGSLAFLVSSLLIVWVYPDLNRFWGSLAALCATLIELLPIQVDDNLTIPLVAGALMFFGVG